jgi:hypothetical protein
MHRPRRLTFAAVALVAATLLAACGDDDDDSTASTTAATTTATASSTASSSGASTSSGTETTTGSSGGGEVGTQQDYVDTATEEIRFEDEDIGGCVAEAIVSDKVYAAIQKAGLTVEDFKNGTESIGTLSIDEAEATSVAHDMAACGDLLSQALSDEHELACAKESLSNEEYAQGLSYQLFGIDPPADLKEKSDAIGKCVGASTSSVPSAPSTTT